MESWYDVRVEMKSMGHNLTSVLINPRESMYDEFYDEFAYEQNETTLAESELLASSLTTAEDTIEVLKTIKELQGIFKVYYEIHAENSSSAESSTTSTKSRSFTNFLRPRGDVSNALSSASESIRLKSDRRNSSGTNQFITSDEDVLNCFKQVPELFFRSDFNLKHSDTFDSALDISTRGHDKLVKYLDYVEIALLRTIWTRSHDFFRALKDIRNLEIQVIQAVIHIKGLRVQLQNADEALGLGAIQIPTLYRRQCNEEKLHEKILCIQRFLDDVNVIGTLVQRNDYTSALQMIVSARKTYEEDLCRIECVGAAHKRLVGYESAVYEYLSDLFVAIGVRDDSMAQPESLSSLLGETAPSSSSSSSDRVHWRGSEDLEDCRDIVTALLVANQFSQAMHKYSARLDESLQLTVRTCILEYSTPLLDEEQDWQERGGDKATGRMLKLMRADTFMSFLYMAIELLTTALRRVVRIKEVIDVVVESHSSTVQSSSTKPPAATVVSNPKAVHRTDNVSPHHSCQSCSSSASGALCSKCKGLSNSCLVNAVELASKTIAHVLSLRSDANVKLGILDMKMLIETALEFASSLESISSGQVNCSVLKQGLLTQTKGYIHFVHESSKANLVNVMDNEKWEQADVSADKQQQLDKVVSGRSFKLDADRSREEASDSANSASKKKELSSAVVDGVSFKVVFSALYLVDVLFSYLEIAFSFPSITTEVITKMSEILTLFDTRARQLVLGAQAIQAAARLKSISAKHLCLTAQSLGLVVAVLPHIRVALLTQLPPKHHILLTGVDRMNAAFLEHHGQVLSKFVDIVCDFLDASSTRLPSIDWDNWKDSTVPYFDEAVKNVTALHRVLEANLPVEQLQDVFSRIFAALSRKMFNHFENIKPSSQAGKLRIVDEVSHLVHALSRLKKVDLSNFTIEASFQSKYLQQAS